MMYIGLLLAVMVAVIAHAVTLGRKIDMGK